MASTTPKRRLDRYSVDARSVANLSEASGGFAGDSNTVRRAAASKPPSADSWGLTGLLSMAFLTAVAAYYSLNYFGGAEFDYLKIPLPLVPHTQDGYTPPTAKKTPAPSNRKPAANLFDRPKSPPRDVQPAGFTAPLPEPATEAKPLPKPPISTLESADPSEGLAVAVETPEVFPVFSSDELGQAFVEARQAIGCATCDSSGYISQTVVTAGDNVDGRPVELEGERRTLCPTCRGRPAIRLNQQAYVRLCRLAETLTFVAFEEDDPQVEPRKQAVRQLLLRTAGDRSRVENLGRLAGLWLARSDREGHGILLAGTIQGVEQSGPYWATRLMLFGMPNEVTVLSADRVAWTPRQRVLVAGYIVDDPANRLPGYDGQLSTVIWGGLPLRLPEEAR